LNEEAALKYSQTKKYYMSKGFTVSESDKMANKSLQKEFSSTATLLAYKDVYLVMTFISFIPVLLIFLLGIGKRPVQSIEVEPIPI